MERLHFRINALCRVLEDNRDTLIKTASFALAAEYNDLRESIIEGNEYSEFRSQLIPPPVKLEPVQAKGVDLLTFAYQLRNVEKWNVDQNAQTKEINKMGLLARIDNFLVELETEKYRELPRMEHFQKYNELAKLFKQEYSVVSGFCLATLRTSHNNILAWTRSMRSVIDKWQNTQTKLESAMPDAVPTANGDWVDKNGNKVEGPNIQTKEMGLPARIDRLCADLKASNYHVSSGHIQEYNYLVSQVKEMYSVTFVLATFETTHSNILSWTRTMRATLKMPHINKAPQTKLRSAGRPPEDVSNESVYRGVLREIVEMTNPDAPQFPQGIYEPTRIQSINNMARATLGGPYVSRDKWSHNRDKCNEHEPMAVSPVRIRPIGQGFDILLVEQALAKLSGDFNYDNVAEAKEILKQIIG